MDISPEYYGLIEMGISFVAVLAMLGWTFWSLRDKPGDGGTEPKTDDEHADR